MNDSVFKESNYNFDDELEEKFEELFGNNSSEADTSVAATSMLIETIHKKREQSVISSFFSHNGEVPSAEEVIQYTEIKSLMPIELMQNSGKHFSIIDSPGNKTLVYAIYICVDSSTDTSYYSLKRLESDEVVDEDGNTSRTFYIDDPQENGNQLVITTMCNDCALINMGILMGNEVRVANNPYVFYFKGHYKNASLIHVNNSCCDISNLSDGEVFSIESSENPRKYEARIDADSIIIDTVTQEPVLRKLYYDNNLMKWRANITIIPYRTYYAFRAGYDAGELRKPLAQSTIGRYLLNGTKGYKKDIEQGIEYLEEDGSPYSLFLIAQAFFDDDSIQDEAIAKEYLFASAEKGCLDAVTECFSITIPQSSGYEEYMQFLDAVVDKESAAYLFIKAAMSEYFCRNSADEILRLYYASAQKGFKPAQYRLSEYTSHVGDAWRQYISITNASEYYDHSKSSDSGDFEYCLGAVLLYGIGIDCTARTKQAGVFLMEKSIEKGNLSALYELFNYYINCANDLIIDYLSKYVELLIAIERDSERLIRISNDLFDCEPHGNECDKVALIALEKAYSLDKSNPTILNNLGWAYLNGRGCECDYQRAIKFSNQAASLGSSKSYYRLGTIYEQGFGLHSPNLDLALEYYQKAANMGHEKSTKKLDELIKKTETEASGSLEQVITNQRRMQATLDAIDERTVQMQNQLFEIVHFTANDLQKWLQHEKLRLENLITGADDELSITESISRSNQYINQQVGSADGLVDEETAELKALFGDVWDRLLTATQAALVSAGVLWKSCFGITRDDFDYSGICISSTSALECELRRWFYTGYQEFLLKTVGNPAEMDPDEVWQKWPEELLDTDMKKYKRIIDNGGKKPTIGLSASKDFTMGMLPYLFYKKGSSNQSMIKPYLQSIVKQRYRYNPGKAMNDYKNPNSFVNQCEKVRVFYRNPAAHTEIIPRDVASACYQQIIGKTDAYLHNTKVLGLIMLLYEYIA